MVALVALLVILSFGLETLYGITIANILPMMYAKTVVIDEYFSTLLGENATALQMALLPISLDINLQEQYLTVI